MNGSTVAHPSPSTHPIAGRSGAVSELPVMPGVVPLVYTRRYAALESGPSTRFDYGPLP
ncbi:MAG: hypothetical protein IT328_09605 [Caldilineaceae bacterium]|nr:hypothetical protein [Caldilineaceae bacterium]